MDFWSNVKDAVLSPFANPKVKLVAVMLIIPLFVNVSPYISLINGRLKQIGFTDFHLLGDG